MVEALVEAFDLRANKCPHPVCHIVYTKRKFRRWWIWLLGAKQLPIFCNVFWLGLSGQLWAICIKYDRVVDASLGSSQMRLVFDFSVHFRCSLNELNLYTVSNLFDSKPNQTETHYGSSYRVAMRLQKTNFASILSDCHSGFIVPHGPRVVQLPISRIDSTDSL